MKKNIIVALLFIGVLTLNSVGMPFGASNTHAYATNEYSEWTDTTNGLLPYVQPAGLSGARVTSDGASTLFLQATRQGTTGYFISHDLGASWAPVTLPSALTSTSPKIQLAANGSILVHGYIDDGDVYYLSKDYGSTWKVLAPSGAHQPPQSFDGIISADGNTIVLRHTDGTNEHQYYVSHDRGTSWIIMNPDSSYFYPMAVSGNGQVIIANDLNLQTWKDELYISRDGGSTWNQSFPNGAIERWSVASVSGDGATIAAIGLKDDYGHVLYLSHDSGITWREMSDATSAGGVSVSEDGQVITTNGPTSVSWDGGESWQSALPVNSNQQYAAPQARNDGFILLDSTTNVYIKLKGATPEAEPVGLLTTGMDNRELTLATSTDGLTILAIATPQAGPTGIVVSRDSGDTWHAAGISGGDSIEYKSLGISDNGSVMAVLAKDAFERTTVHISRDSGRTWHSYSPGPTDVEISIIEGSMASNGSLMLLHGVDMTTYTGYTYVSYDKGENWSELEAPVSSDIVISSVISQNGTVIVITDISLGDSSVRIHVSNDRGVTWSSPINLDSMYGEIRLSADGSRLIVTSYSTENAIRIASTKDVNGTIQTITPSNNPSEYYHEINLSRNGSVVAAASLDQDTGESFLYTSRDRGLTWSVAPFHFDSNLSLSGDGTTITAIARDGESKRYTHYISRDNGVTWKELLLPEQDNELLAYSQMPYGLHLQVSDDASIVYAVSIEGYMYRHLLPTVPGDGNNEPTSPTVTFNPTQGSSSAPLSKNPSAPQYIVNTKPTFSGTATPKSVVTVTVRSDPITCTTVAASNGNWSCTLPSNIPAGSHTLTVEITDPDTNETQLLGPFYLAVASTTPGSEAVTNSDVLPTAPNTGISPLLINTNSAATPLAGSVTKAVDSAVESYGLLGSIAGLALLVWLGRSLLPPIDLRGGKR